MSIGQAPPLAGVRAAQEDAEPAWTAIVREAIIERLKAGPVHADDLEGLFPEHCRKLVGAQFGSLASRHYIHGIEYRKSTVLSRKGAKSWVYDFTRLGREKLAGFGAGPPLSPCPESGSERGGSLSTIASAEPGEMRSGGNASPAPGAPARLFELPAPRPAHDQEAA